MKFHEIFSKEKEIEELKPKIIVDYREKNSFIPYYLLEHGYEVEFRELKVADYIVKDVAIERKTISDFISSMINKRLSKQLEELQQYPNRILMIEGLDEQELYSNNEKNGIHPNAIRGFLLSILLNHNIPIIFTKNYEDSAKYIEVLSKRTKKTASLNVSKKSLDKNERLQFIMESFPGIGPKTAKKLLKKYGSIKEIINAPKNELEEIIGKKSEVLFNLSNTKYSID